MSSEGGGHSGRVVPVYAVTGGRTRAAGGLALPLEAVVVCATGGVVGGGGSLPVEARVILELCVRPRSLAEVGAALGVPLRASA